MADKLNVAKMFIMLFSRNEDNSLTNLKLNKLMYFAQGVQLSRTQKPLFDDVIEAWPLGPVIPSVYHSYKIYGSNPIEFDGVGVPGDVFSPDELESILDVYREIGQYTARRLVDMTHKPGTPWEAADRLGQTTISQASIQDYFTRNPVARFSIGSATELVTELPADWYDPAEDAEWEAYLE